MTMRTLTWILAAVLAIPCTGHALTGDEIIKKVIDREVPATSQATVTMTLTDKNGGVRKREIQSYFKKYGKGSKSIIRFLAPPDVKGMGFLHIEEPGKDEQFIYMPEMKRVRRVAGGQRRQSFFGSDFTYQDMERREADADSHTLVKEEAVDGVDTYVVESSPRKPEDSQYGKVVEWIRKDNYIPVKAHFFNKEGEHIKTLAVDTVEQNSDGTWTVKKSTMSTHKTVHRTVVDVSHYKTNMPLADSLFTERSLAKE